MVRMKITKQDKKTMVGIIGAVIFSQGLVNIMPEWVPSWALIAAGAFIVIITQ